MFYKSEKIPESLGLIFCIVTYIVLCFYLAIDYRKSGNSEITYSDIMNKRPISFICIWSVIVLQCGVIFSGVKKNKSLTGSQSELPNNIEGGPTKAMSIGKLAILTIIIVFSLLFIVRDIIYTLKSDNTTEYFKPKTIDYILTGIVTIIAILITSYNWWFNYLKEKNNSTPSYTRFFIYLFYIFYFILFPFIAVPSANLPPWKYTENNGLMTDVYETILVYLVVGCQLLFITGVHDVFDIFFCTLNEESNSK